MIRQSVGQITHHVSSYLFKREKSRSVLCNCRYGSLSTINNTIILETEIQFKCASFEFRFVCEFCFLLVVCRCMFQEKIQYAFVIV